MSCLEADTHCHDFRTGQLLCGSCLHNHRIWEKLAEYEEAEEQGHLLKLPCKVGDVVYLPWFELVTSAYTRPGKKGIIETKVREIIFKKDGLFLQVEHLTLEFHEEAIGSLLFFDRKDAVQALEREW